MTILIPAYGRDYKSEAAVKKDFQDGKDFRVADVSDGWDGSYCSIRDFKGKQVKIRYARLTKFIFIDVEDNE